MSETTAYGATRVWWTSAGAAPIEVPVESIKIRMERVEPEPLSFYNPPVLIFRGRNREVARALWEWAQAARRRRRRMHSAYGRKRGRGRW